ncbi:MAG: esterase family protein [Phycisphaerales bacterium]|nr:MAG: esterase family protein [Phycisphaerales bacterium]
MATRAPIINAALAALVIAPCVATTPALAQQWVTPAVDAPQVERRIFQSAAAGAFVSYHVYTPPVYDTQPERGFPVLYWLHGANSVLTGIGPVSAWFDAAIAEGRIPPMLIVFPNGLQYGMWCNSKNGATPMETIVIDELIPAVDAAFRTIPVRSGRIVEGFSMGGYGAARLGFRHNTLFGGVSMLGAGPLQQDFLDEPPGSNIPFEQRLIIYEQVWGSDPAYFLQESPWTIVGENAAAIIAGAQRVRQAVGQLDFVVPANLDFQQRLTDLAIPHEFYFPAGVGHAPLLLMTAMGETNWNFYRDVFGPACPGDTNADGVVNFTDLNAVLGDFGQMGDDLPGDVNGDGVVDFADLNAVLGNFGAVCR